MAAYELVQMGFDNIYVLKGGFTDWTKSGRCALPCCSPSKLGKAHSFYM